jgi:hypothetical protein
MVALKNSRHSICCLEEVPAGCARSEGEVAHAGTWEAVVRVVEEALREGLDG